jgi:putative transposase
VLGSMATRRFRVGTGAVPLFQKDEMKRYRVYPEDHNVYFCTSTIVEWLPIFSLNVYFRITIDSLKYCQANKGLNLIAYVIMPEHIHLVTSNLETASLSDIMRDFKRFTSKKISGQLRKNHTKVLLEVLEKSAQTGKGNTAYKVWQDDFHPEAVYSEPFLQQKIDYIHQNPVRRGLVSKPEDWPYSSARNYVSNDETVITVDKFLERI